MARTSTSDQAQTGTAGAAEALAFARRAHAGQLRKQSGDEFIEHAIEVAELLAGTGQADELVAAAYLHDVVEKTAVGLAEVRAEFGQRVAGLVGALTEDASLRGYAARKRALRLQVLAAGPDPVLIYAADRVANLRDWRRADPAERPAIAERLGTGLAERLALWQQDLDELTALDPELPFLAEIELDLRALRSDAEAAEPGA